MVARFRVCGLADVVISKNNTKILESYKITKKEEMIRCLEYIDFKNPLYVSKRSINSRLREWIAHNRLYNWGLFLSHTTDCDLEEDIKPHIRLIYFILSLGG